MPSAVNDFGNQLRLVFLLFPPSKFAVQAHTTRKCKCNMKLLWSVIGSLQAAPLNYSKSIVQVIDSSGSQNPNLAGEGRACEEEEGLRSAETKETPKEKGDEASILPLAEFLISLLQFHDTME